MIIKEKQINQYLNHSLYFLYGNDLLAQTVFHTVVPPLPNSNITTFYLDADFEWYQLQKQFLPSIDDQMMHQIIKWYWLEVPNPQIVKALSDLVKHLDQNHRLIIFYEKKDKKHRTQKWWKTLDSNGMIVDLWPPKNTPEIWRWIQANTTVRLSNSELKIITDYLGNDLLTIKQVLNQLPLLPSPLTLKNVIQSFLGYRTYDLYDLLNAIWEKDPKQVTVIYQTLNNVTHFPLILWGLANDLRLIWELKNQTLTLENAKIPFYRQKALQMGCNRVTLTQIKTWWQNLLNFEQAFKTGEKKDLLPLLLKMALND